MLPKLYTLAEVQKILGVCRRTMYSYMAQGRITGRKVGGKWMISEENLAAFMNPPQGEGDAAQVKK